MYGGGIPNVYSHCAPPTTHAAADAVGKTPAARRKRTSTGRVPIEPHHIPIALAWLLAAPARAYVAHRDVYAPPSNARVPHGTARAGNTLRRVRDIRGGRHEQIACAQRRTGPAQQCVARDAAGAARDLGPVYVILPVPTSVSLHTPASGTRKRRRSAASLAVTQ